MLDASMGEGNPWVTPPADPASGDAGRQNWGETEGERCEPKVLQPCSCHSTMCHSFLTLKSLARFFPSVNSMFATV